MNKGDNDVTTTTTTTILVVIDRGGVEENVGLGESEHGCGRYVGRKPCDLQKDIGQSQSSIPPCIPWGFIRLVCIGMGVVAQGKSYDRLLCVG